MTTLHLQAMTPQEYIQLKLDELKQRSAQSQDGKALKEAIFKVVISKKFRKYSAKPELIEHIRNAIALNVQNNTPINITYVNGGYKLWRLQESPEVDWAELFSLMRYIKWLKPICEIYKPGVWLDFYMDDLIVPILNNVTPEDPSRYIESFRKLVNFLEPFLPQNFRITVTKVGDQFKSQEAFQESLQKSIEITKEKYQNEMLILSDAMKHSIELNVKASKVQREDPHWKEKVALIHEAYFLTKAEPGYHNQPTKIKAFTTPLPSNMVVAVGTTSRSIMKFWIGAGVLLKNGESFSQEILSPTQLQNGKFSRASMSIPGLTLKNFSEIRIKL